MDTDILTLAPQFEYGQDGEVKSATASSEPTQVPAGGYLSFYQKQYWCRLLEYSLKVQRHCNDPEIIQYNLDTSPTRARGATGDFRGREHADV